MTSGDWIADARAEYERKPWVSWALRFGAPLDAVLDTVKQAAAASIAGVRTMPRDRARAELEQIERDGGDHGRAFAQRVRAAVRRERARSG